MAAAHTPGPWQVNPLHGAQVVCFVNGKPMPVASATMTLLWSKNAADEVREVAANAHLIAAAPDLLEALEIIVAAFDALPQSDPARCSRLRVNLARGAIAKATEAAS